jgi:hypothetical protein
MQYNQTYKIEQALRKSIANDLFIKRDRFKDSKDLEAAIKIVEKKD